MGCCGRTDGAMRPVSVFIVFVAVLDGEEVSPRFATFHEARVAAKAVPGASVRTVRDVA